MSEAIVNIKLFESVIDKIDVVSLDSTATLMTISIDISDMVIDTDLAMAYLDNAVMNFEKDFTGKIVRTLTGTVKSKDLYDYIYSKKVYTIRL